MTECFYPVLGLVAAVIAWGITSFLRREGAPLALTRPLFLFLFLGSTCILMTLFNTVVGFFTNP
jgi:hypothetical protein